MKRNDMQLRHILCFVLLLTLFVSGCASSKNMENQIVEMPLDGMLEGRTIVLDAGHGGFDGGAVGRTTNVREDILNLQVTRKLEALLQQAGAKVLLTRETDDGLNNPESPASRWKRDDMNTRFRFIRDSGADLMLSIHMNKFTQPSVYGAQVFYQHGDDEAADFANMLQSMLHTLPEAGKRVVKTGDYMVLKTKLPMSALVECGFLSNPNDEMLLQDEDYQHRLAWCLYAAITTYFHLS